MRYHWSCGDVAFAGHFDDARGGLPSCDGLSDSRRSTSITGCRQNSGATPLRKGCHSPSGGIPFLTGCCLASGVASCSFSKPKWNRKTLRRRGAGCLSAGQEVHEWYGEDVGKILRHRCRAKNGTCGSHRICRRGCHLNCSWSNRCSARKATP